jgi:4,5-dihydroxyphthalate decarboxylase
MPKLPLTLVIKDYDYVTPLLLGDAVAEGIDLKLDRKSGIAATTDNPNILAGETSFSKHLIRLSRGDRRYVGIPFFPYHGFRHRCFFIKRGSPLRSLKDLEGKRIGTNGWPDTGNTWSRAALREQGVRIDSIQWWVGPVDDPNTPNHYQGDEPKNVRPAGKGQALRDMLLKGELDALMCPLPPKGFYDANSPIVRLIPDYRKAEQEYLGRTGVYPGHHIIVVQRVLYEKEPWILWSLCDALDNSKLRWNQTRAIWTEFSPWMLADIEDAMRFIGPDWHPSGIEPNQKMIQSLCDEEFAQGLAKEPIDSKTVFAEYQAELRDAAKV